MEFDFKTLFLGFTEHYVWHRDTGNLVIIVIDDECGVACKNSDNLLDPQLAILPQLREVVCMWSETRAIGFFRLMDTTQDADEVLQLIHEWLKAITFSDTQVCFLVDFLYGGTVSVASNHTIKELTCLYPQNPIAYLTRAGASPTVPLLPGYTVFQKAQHADYVLQHGKFRPDLMSFFGKGRHEDTIIADAIEFYAKPWEENWTEDGWHHDRLQETDSAQLRALAEWLGSSISINELHKSPHEGESAKSLMIWKAEDLWEEPPWEGGIRRSIQGNVLNAALEKFGMPFSVPKEKAITMPCVPCFPFLVSLRNFLWFCVKEEDRADVEKIRFSNWGENPQVNMISLMLPLKNSARLAKKFFGIERQGTFTNALIDVTHCRTDGLRSDGDYMRLFSEGTELPVVAVEIVPNQINLIWSVG